MPECMEIYIETSDFKKLDIEQLGTKEKFWLVSPKGVNWLFKFSRPGAGEHWSEVCAALIANKLGIAHAEYYFSRWEGKIGVVTPSFVEKNEYLVMGNEILKDYDPYYPSSSSEEKAPKAYTPKEVFDCLKKFQALEPFQWKGESPTNIFFDYLFLDALVGNVDRHHENWGIVVNSLDKTKSLAVTFDHASSLGRELTEKRKKDRLKTKDKNYSVLAYSKKAKTPFYESKIGRRLDAVEVLFSFLELDPSLKQRLEALIRICEQQEISQIINSIPSIWMADLDKTFAKKLIEVNLERIKQNA